MRKITCFLFSFVSVVLLAVYAGADQVSFARGYGQVSGRLITESGILPQGTLAFFSVDAGSDPADRSILRVPERTATVDAQGRFAVLIQHGRYFLGYFSGQQKHESGLPNETFNPLLAGNSDSGRYVLHVEDPQQDTGDVVFYPVVNGKPGPSFTVKGTVRTSKGKPVSGVTVVAKTKLNSLRPQYISRKTDSTGLYSMVLPPGSYYLVARHRLKTFGRPDTGEYFGILGVDGPAGEFGWFPFKKDQDFAIHGEDRQVIPETDITVFKIPDPTQQEQDLRAKGDK